MKEVVNEGNLCIVCLGVICYIMGEIGFKENIVDDLDKMLKWGFEKFKEERKNMLWYS